MKEEPTIAVSEAAQQYNTPKPTLASWIKKEIIKATRSGDGERSPWMINVASLEAHLKKNGKLPKSPAEEDQQDVIESDSLPVSQEMPSLRDHHIAPVNHAIPKSETATPPKPITTAEGNHTDRHPGKTRKQKRPPQGRSKPSTFPFRITTRQLKDAMAYMTLDETLQMRNWLNERLDKKLNS